MVIVQNINETNTDKRFDAIGLIDESFVRFFLPSPPRGAGHRLFSGLHLDA